MDAVGLVELPVPEGDRVEDAEPVSVVVVTTEDDAAGEAVAVVETGAPSPPLAPFGNGQGPL